MKYIYQTNVWPQFIWGHKEIEPLLAEVRNAQGKLTGRMEALGLACRSEAALETLTLEIVKSSEIEGEILDSKQVRSSIARRLGMEIGGLVSSDRYVDGIVEMMLEATQNFKNKLTAQRLFGWHASLFPTGYSGMHKIIVGAWRDDKRGPMQVVSGPLGRERVHFQAPEAKRLKSEMNNFLRWFNFSSENKNKEIDPVLRSAIAHLWFVTLHPFEDGNGRIARAIADMQLARADGLSERFYSMSVQIRQERNAYYDVLEKTQKSNNASTAGAGINITMWLAWYLGCLNRALETSEKTLDNVFKKARFWQAPSFGSLNERQKIMVTKLLEDFSGKLTSSKWAKMTKCSQDTALRDILDLVEKGILVKDSLGGRSTSYSLRDL